jgi:hypothetical protein
LRHLPARGTARGGVTALLVSPFAGRGAFGPSLLPAPAGSNASRRSSVIANPVASSGASGRSARPCTQIWYASWTDSGSSFAISDATLAASSIDSSAAGTVWARASR